MQTERWWLSLDLDAPGGPEFPVFVGALALRVPLSHDLLGVFYPVVGDVSEKEGQTFLLSFGAFAAVGGDGLWEDLCTRNKEFMIKQETNNFPQILKL